MPSINNIIACLVLQSHIKHLVHSLAIQIGLNCELSSYFHLYLISKFILIANSDFTLGLEMF